MTTSRTKPMQYGEPFQKEIIHLMLLDPSFCGKACDNLKPTDFARELSWFFDTIKSYKGMPPSKGSLVADISKHDEDKQEAYLRILDEIYQTKPDKDKIFKEMTRFIRANIFVDACLDAVKFYNAGKLDEAFVLTENRMQALNRVNFGYDGNAAISSWREVVSQAQFESSNSIKTNIYAIDKAMGGGLMPGTWTTFLGSSNAGKSMINGMLAREAVMQGKRVYITVHEDEPNPTKLRYLAAFTEIPINKLAFGVAFLTAEEQELLDFAESLLSKYVRFRFMYSDQSTVENVMSKCRELMRDWAPDTEHPQAGFDLYLCDYGQCLRSAELKSREERHVQEHVYHMLKQLCLELNIAGAGGAQVNRTANKVNSAGADWLRMTDVAEAYGITKKSSNVITVNRSDEDVINNRVVFLLDKCRNGPAKIAVECESDYSRGMVYKPDSTKQVDLTGMLGDGPKSRTKEESRPVSPVYIHENKVQQE